MLLANTLTCLKKIVIVLENLKFNVIYRMYVYKNQLSSFLSPSFSLNAAFSLAIIQHAHKEKKCQCSIGHRKSKPVNTCHFARWCKNNGSRKKLGKISVFLFLREYRFSSNSVTDEREKKKKRCAEFRTCFITFQVTILLLLNKPSLWTVKLKFVNLFVCSLFSHGPGNSQISKQKKK